MNRLRRHHIDLGLSREESGTRERALLGPSNVRVFGRHGKIAGRRYEMNVRGGNCDQIQLREPHDSDSPRDMHTLTYGPRGLGAELVLDHLRAKPMLP